MVTIRKGDKVHVRIFGKVLLAIVRAMSSGGELFCELWDSGQHVAVSTRDVVAG